ncbi:hypothetical protein [Blautia obeum]|uniref:hypothetical protein n=1 Tax=Blautia obeum TaxID=40520 RepID=UPI001FA82ADF|nr:hypothetical protein [Blautia obeum]
MRKERKIINTNIRLNLCDEQDRQAWEYLQTMDRQKYKSYTKAVVAALNDYFAREYGMKKTHIWKAEKRKMLFWKE